MSFLDYWSYYSAVAIVAISGVALLTSLRVFYLTHGPYKWTLVVTACASAWLGCLYLYSTLLAGGGSVPAYIFRPAIALIMLVVLALVTGYGRHGH